MTSGLFISDLDGTLLTSDGEILPKDLSALEFLKRHGIKTAVATGRSLYSFKQSAAAELPVDFVIFSSGAGVIGQLSPELLYHSNIPADSVKTVLEFMSELKLDFMLHFPAPENHKFLYRRVSDDNADFEDRINRYREFSAPLTTSSLAGFGEASQLVAIVPPDKTDQALYDSRNASHGLSVIRATSPLDHQSTWIEFFNPAVSKGKTAEWLASELNVNTSNTAAIGNDYNDQDLLEWAAHSFVVENAAPELKSSYEQVKCNNSGGVAEAIKRWLKRI